MAQVSHEELQRSLGRVEGNQDGFRERMDRFEQKIDEGFSKVGERLNRIDEHLSAIDRRESERRGAWKVIVLVAGGVSAAVAGLLKFILS